MVKVVCYNCGAEFETGRIKIGDGKERDYFLYEDLPPCPNCGAEGCLGHGRPDEVEAETMEQVKELLAAVGNAEMKVS